MTHVQQLIERESYRLRWLKVLAGGDATKFAYLANCQLFQVALDGKDAVFPIRRRMTDASKKPAFVFGRKAA